MREPKGFSVNHGQNPPDLSVGRFSRITHAIAGLTIATAYIGATRDYSAVSVVPILAAGLTGGVFPDIDYRLGDARKENTIWKHRGICHTLLFLAMFVIAMVSFEKYAGYDISGAIIVFSLAFLSHLFLDSFNFIGLPLFYPLSLKPFRHYNIVRAGSFKEYIFITLPLVVILVLTAKSAFSPAQLSHIFSHGEYFLRKIIY
ncbi:MAG: metal-dependent hydrolase [bacterium]